MPRRSPVDGDVPATAGQPQHRARRGLRKRSSVGTVLRAHYYRQVEVHPEIADYCLALAAYYA